MQNVIRFILRTVSVVLLLVLIISSIGCADLPLTATDARFKHGADFIKKIGKPFVYAGTNQNAAITWQQWKQYNIIPQYTFGYSTNSRSTTWVAYTLLASDAIDVYHLRPKTGFMSWRGFAAENDDYTGSGVNRGHMRRAGHTTYSKKAYLNTFYMFNVMPQFKYFNQSSQWRGHEGDSLLYLGTDKDKRVYIIVGTILGSGHYGTLGKNKIPVPIGYWRAEWWTSSSFITHKSMVTSGRVIMKGYIYSHNVRNADNLNVGTVKSFTNFSDMAAITGVDINFTQ